VVRRNSFNVFYVFYLHFGLGEMLDFDLGCMGEWFYLSKMKFLVERESNQQ
jgi:hypothetical protein